VRRTLDDHPLGFRPEIAHVPGRAHLGRRGHGVADTDDLGCIVDVDTARGIEPTWDLDRVRALVDGHYEGWLFVAGCVANQGVVAFLSARVDVPLARVVDVPNPFGSHGQNSAPRSRATSRSSSRCNAPAPATRLWRRRRPSRRSSQCLSAWRRQLTGEPAGPDSDRSSVNYPLLLGRHLLSASEPAFAGG